MSKFDRIKQFMPGLYQVGNNKVITALFKGVAQSDDQMVQAIADCKDQLFVATASDQYLDLLGSGYGVNRPVLVQIGDEEYSRYIQLASFHEKTVRQLMYDILDIFFGPAATHATVESVNSETFNFLGGPHYLTLIADNNPEMSVKFVDADFVDPANATAQEVVNKINFIAGGSVASAIDDMGTGVNFVQIRTRTPGLAGAIHVTGGNANAILGFDTTRVNKVAVAVVEIFPKQIIITIPENIVLRYTLRGSHHFHPDANIVDPRPAGIDTLHPFWPGSFLYDHTGPGMQTIGYGVTNITCLTTAQILAGAVINQIGVDDCSLFPATPGRIVFNWGRQGMEFVNTTGRIAPTILGIDPTHVFRSTWAIGTKIFLLEPEWDPRVNQTYYDYPIYFIDTAVGETLVTELFDLIKAAGVILVTDINRTTYLYGP